jgi:hypothetical protein
MCASLSVRVCLCVCISLCERVVCMCVCVRASTCLFVGIGIEVDSSMLQTFVMYLDYHSNRSVYPTVLMDSSMLGVKPNDRSILLHLLGGGGINLRNIPPPQRLPLHLKFSTPQGIKQIAFHRHDFYISFLRFFNPPRGWGAEQQQLKNCREAIETNRCFFIHLGIAINVHPFALQVGENDLSVIDCEII